MLDDAFIALKKYDWGSDKAALAPIDDAVTATHGNAEARADLEKRLLAALQSDVSRDAQDYVCRKLTIVGTAASAPALAGLLNDKDRAHMARFALERIPGPEAGQALRDALPKASGNLKIGIIGSIGARRDPAAVAALKELLRDVDASIARSAAVALGDIGTSEAVQALQTAAPADAAAKQVAIDAQLACAETLLSNGKKAEALAVYKSLSGEQQSKLVRLAATRGVLACAGKKE